MPSIHDALMQAQKEREQGRDPGDSRVATAPAPSTQEPRGQSASARRGSGTGDGDVSRKLLGLYRGALASAGKPCPTILFLGASAGAGASELAVETAFAAARLLRDPVTLVDAKPRPTHWQRFGSQPKHTWFDAMRDGHSVAEGLSDASDLPISIAWAAGGGLPASAVFGDSRFASFAAPLRESKRIILIDALPAEESADSVALGGVVDGVILVVEAEETRWQAAQNLRQSVERMGGRVLGAVLNKRRHYIPRFIYDRL